MSLRLALFATVLLTFTGGCAVAHDDATEGATADSEQAAKARICPAIYDPVCGKDGKTYSSTCAAGGAQRVAYKGECIDSCAAVLCAPGTVCVTKGHRAQCVSSGSDPCAVVRCAAGTHCEATGDSAQCVADDADPCATVRCMAGYHCEAIQVQCITAPCPPVAECVPN